MQTPQQSNDAAFDKLVDYDKVNEAIAAYRAKRGGRVLTSQEMFEIIADSYYEGKNLGLSRRERRDNKRAAVKQMMAEARKLKTRFHDDPKIHQIAVAAGMAPPIEESTHG